MVGRYSLVFRSYSARIPLLFRSYFSCTRLRTSGCQTSACISLPAPVNPRAGFQHCPGLFAETLIGDYGVVVRETDCNLF